MFGKVAKKIVPLLTLATLATVATVATVASPCVVAQGAAALSAAAACLLAVHSRLFLDNFPAYCAPPPLWHRLGTVAGEYDPDLSVTLNPVPGWSESTSLLWKWDFRICDSTKLDDHVTALFVYETKQHKVSQNDPKDFCQGNKDIYIRDMKSLDSMTLEIGDFLDIRRPLHVCKYTTSSASSSACVQVFETSRVELQVCTSLLFWKRRQSVISLHSIVKFSVLLSTVSLTVLLLLCYLVLFNYT